MSELTEEDINMAIYFLKEKGDITRWCGWEDRKKVFAKEFPMLFIALEKERAANQLMDATIRELEAYQ